MKKLLILLFSILVSSPAFSDVYYDKQLKRMFVLWEINVPEDDPNFAVKPSYWMNDLQLFKDYIEQNEVKDIYFDGIGGSILTGNEMIKIINKNNIPTIYGKLCLSMCGSISNQVNEPKIFNNALFQLHNPIDMKTGATLTGSDLKEWKGKLIDELKKANISEELLSRFEKLKDKSQIILNCEEWVNSFSKKMTCIDPILLNELTKSSEVNSAIVDYHSAEDSRYYELLDLWNISNK